MNAVLNYSNQLANERAVWDVRQFVSMTRPAAAGKICRPRFETGRRRDWSGFRAPPRVPNGHSRTHSPDVTRTQPPIVGSAPPHAT